jgi:hypothetical protein
MMDALVAGSAETSLLKELPPELVLEAGTPSVADRLAAIQPGRDEIKELAAMITQAQAKLNEREANAYLDLIEREGELAAARWLRQREAAPAP